MSEEEFQFQFEDELSEDDSQAAQHKPAVICSSLYYSAKSALRDNSSDVHALETLQKLAKDQDTPLPWRCKVLAFLCKFTLTQDSEELSDYVKLLLSLPIKNSLVRKSIIQVLERASDLRSKALPRLLETLNEYTTFEHKDYFYFYLEYLAILNLFENMSLWDAYVKVDHAIKELRSSKEVQDGQQKHQFEFKFRELQSRISFKLNIGKAFEDTERFLGSLRGIIIFPWLQGNFWDLYGQFLSGKGENQKASECFQTAAELYREIGDDVQIIRAYLHLACTGDTNIEHCELLPVFNEILEQVDKNDFSNIRNLERFDGDDFTQQFLINKIRDSKKSHCHELITETEPNELEIDSIAHKICCSIDETIIILEQLIAENPQGLSLKETEPGKFHIESSKGPRVAILKPLPSLRLNKRRHI